MRKQLILVVGLLYLLLPFVGLAATVKVGDNYTLRKGEKVEEDLYAFGANTTIAGNVTGDLIVAGVSVFSGGSEIEDGALIFADTAHIISAIKMDLRAVARKIYIGGSIGEDVSVAALSVEILPNARIGGSFIAAAGNVSILGEVKGDLKVAAGEIFIDEGIGGDVSAVANKIILGPNAMINGSFTYSASEPAEMREGARVAGEVNYSRINTKSRAEKFLPTLWGTWLLIKFSLLLLSALIAHGILRRISERFVIVSATKFGWSMIRGFLFLVATPIAAFIVMLTFIGIPFSLFALALYGIGILLALVYAPIVLGSILEKIYHRNDNLKVSWKTIFAGVVAFVFMGLIPYVGTIVSYAFILAALGGIYQVLFDKFAEVR